MVLDCGGPPPLAFDLELGRGLHKRGMNVRGFFVGDFFGQARFSPLAGFLGPGFVNVFGANRHVGKNRHAIAGHLHEAVANSEEDRVRPLLCDDFARAQLRHQRHVLRQDAHLAFDAGQRDHVNVVGVNFCLRRDNFQFERIGHFQRIKSLNR